MKANELMVGDWVISRKRGKDEILQVATIDGGSNTFWLDGDGYSGLVNGDDVFPIHLTPEILEKIGFRLHKFNGDIMSGIWWEIPEFVIRENMIDSIGRNNFEYKYVHQLQHALRLCEIDKEIIL